MKRVAVIMLSFACLAINGFGEWLEKDQQTIRMEYIYADDVGTESANGIEVAFGKALIPLDDLAIFFAHLENDDMETQRIGLSLQENFPISWGIPLVPYAGAGIGYGWIDVDGTGPDAPDIDKSGLLLRAEAGALLRLCDYFAISAGARLNFSSKEIFLDKKDLEDTSWDFAFGARFYY